jgi:hypothetical protein
VYIVYFAQCKMHKNMKGCIGIKNVEAALTLVQGAVTGEGEDNRRKQGGGGEEGEEQRGGGRGKCGKECEVYG